MGKYIATVSFDKMVQDFNYEDGAGLESWFTSDDNITVGFTDTHDFKKKLANWVSERFDIDKDDFVNNLDNDIDNNVFFYSQLEDKRGNHNDVTEDNPDGYLADYRFGVVSVAEVINYKF